MWSRQKVHVDFFFFFGGGCFVFIELLCFHRLKMNFLNQRRQQVLFYTIQRPFSTLPLFIYNEKKKQQCRNRCYKHRTSESRTIWTILNNAVMWQLPSFFSPLIWGTIWDGSWTLMSPPQFVNTSKCFCLLVSCKPPLAALKSPGCNSRAYHVSKTSQPVLWFHFYVNVNSVLLLLMLLSERKNNLSFNWENMDTMINA